MALPDDDEITQLTMKSLRINTKLSVHRAKVDSMQQELQDIYAEIVDRCESLGYCFACEESLDECRCQDMVDQAMTDNICFCPECQRQRKAAHGTIN